jgi:hypothetical protein
VGQRQTLGFVRLVAEEQQVDVDRARRVADGVRNVAAQLALDLLAGVEQLLGRQRVSMRAQALRNDGWSRISPTGSVS